MGLQANGAKWLSPTVIGGLCGAAAAVSWAAGLVAARHGVLIGLGPADLAFHRFVWAGCLLLPVVWRYGMGDLGGIGWARGLLIMAIAGPVQAIVAYSGFLLVPLAHGALVQPSNAMLWGLLLATLVLHEPLRRRRVIGASAVVLGLALLASEAMTTIGAHGLLGDLLFASAGMMWAVFGTLLRLWSLPAGRATAVISVLSLLVYAPLHALIFGFDQMIAAGLWENLLQAVVQGVFAGALSIHLFARAVTLLGTGRASAFPALVPPTTLLIGYLLLGETPSLVQLLGLVVFAIGFRFVLKP